MKQPLKKAVALLLVAVMAMGLLGLSALADNEGGDPGIPAETLEPGPVPDGTTGQEEEPKDPVESEEPETTEPVSETPTTEPEDPNTSETPTTEPEEPRESETPDAGQPVEDITDSEIPLETPDAENKESPELELAEGIISLGVNDTTITISGLLPVRAYFTAFPVDIELEDGEVLAAFDITIYDADGNEWQPDDSVHVSIETPDLEDVDEVTVYHMEDEYATPEMVETVNVAGTTKVEFDAESFSVYVITVQNDGNASNETIYATSKRQPVTVTYLTGSDKQVSWTLKSDSVGKLILSDLTSHGRVDGYYKWTFTATLTEQAQAGTTYSFQMNPNKSGYSATDYKIKASEYTLSDFYYVPGSATQLDDAGHVDIRIDNATYTIKTVIEDSAGNPIGDPTFETIQASIANTKQNPPTIIVNGQSKTSSWIASQGSGNEFRSNLNPRVQIKGLTISAIVNLKETTGAKREFNNVTVIFTEDDMVRAILDCDGYKEQKGKNGVQGLDFTVVANTTFTQTVTAGNGANVPGNITISGTKTWDHGSNSANPLPTNTNLTLTLYKKLSTDTEWTAVTAAPTWNSNTYTFTVPYESQATEYKVLETVKPENYNDTASGSGTGYLTTSAITNNIPNCNQSSYGPYTSNFIVAKLTQNEGFTIWTARMVEEGEKAGLITAAQGAFNQVTAANTNFIYGNGASYENPSKGTVTLTIDANNKVTVAFECTAVWAQFAYGTMTTTFTPANGNFTNTYVPPTVTVSGTKSWDDDYTGELAESITVELLKDGNSFIPAQTATADADGGWAYNFPNLDPQYTYTIQEIAVDGTTAENGRFKIIGTSNEVTGVWVPTYNGYNITNTYYESDDSGSGSFTVHKQDNTGAEMQDVTFTLTKEGETTGTAQATDADGNTSFSGLATGTYTLTETAPTGYTGAGPWVVTVTETGKILLETTGPVENVFTNIWNWVVSVVTGDNPANQLSEGVLTVVNTPIIRNVTTPASIEILKTDGTNPLLGAKFKLEKGGFVDHEISGFNGKVSFTMQEAGTYKLTEYRAPLGYTGSSQKWYVAVTAGTPDSGVWNTDHTALIITTPLIATIYTDKELTTPATLTDGKLVVANARQMGTLRLTKDVAGSLDEDDFGIGDFTFTVRNLLGQTVATVTLPDEAGAWTTDITLPTGAYTVTETGKPGNGELPGGHSLKSTTYTYSTILKAIITKGSTVKAKVTNTYAYMPGSATLTATKVWQDNGNAFGLRPLSVRFALYQGENQIDVQDVATIDDSNTSTVELTYDPYASGNLRVEEIGYTDAEGVHLFDENLTSVPGYSSPESEEGSYTIINHLGDTTILTIEKEFTGAAVTANPTLTIKGQTLGYETKVELNKDFNNGLLEIELPLDTYTVTESGAEVSGYTLTTTHAVGFRQQAQAVAFALVDEAELTFEPGSTATLDLIELNYVIFRNNYTPIYIPGPGPGPDPGPGPINSSPTPTENIEDPEPPLEPAPSAPVTDIEDGETPIAYQPDNNAPQTGDTGNILIFIIVAIMSVFGIGVIVFTGSGKKHNK